MRIELLYWSECPSHVRARELLGEAMRSLDLDPGAIELISVESEDAARAHGFVGSPTIRIDGVDIQPPPSGEPYALTCRLYRRRDGRPSPVPDPADLIDALAAAAGAHPTERS